MMRPPFLSNELLQCLDANPIAYFVTCPRISPPGLAAVWKLM